MVAEFSQRQLSLAVEQKVTLRDFAKLFGSRRALAVSAVSSALIVLFVWMVAGTLLSARTREAYAEARRRWMSAMPPAGSEHRYRRGLPQEGEIAEPVAAEFIEAEAIRGAGAQFELREDEAAREYAVELRPSGPEGEFGSGGPVWREHEPPTEGDAPNEAGPQYPPEEEPLPEDSSSEE